MMFVYFKIPSEKLLWLCLGHLQLGAIPHAPLLGCLHKCYRIFPPKDAVDDGH